MCVVALVGETAIQIRSQYQIRKIHIRTAFLSHVTHTSHADKSPSTAGRMTATGGFCSCETGEGGRVVRFWSTRFYVVVPRGRSGGRASERATVVGSGRLAPRLVGEDLVM